MEQNWHEDRSGVHAVTSGPAGLDAARAQVQLVAERLRRGRPARGVLLVGAQRAAATAWLERMQADAEQSGVYTVRMTLQEHLSLPAALALPLYGALMRLAGFEAAHEATVRALRALAGFVGTLAERYGDLDLPMALAPEPGLADNGDLEADLATLFELSGEAARAAGTALIVFADELQILETTQLAAFIAALHRCAQVKLPVALVGAGQLRLRGQVGEARPYAERLFSFVELR
jgi:hypothetical protein